MLKKLTAATLNVLKIRWVWTALLFLFTLGAGLAWGSWKNICADCPSVAQIQTWEPEQSSKLLTQDGELIREIGYRSRTPVSINALPPHVPQSFIAVEDKRFYRHGGVDPRGIARAVWGLVRTRSLSAGGGSTITQQLARNIYEVQIGFERSITRKLKEMQVALELEEDYSKDEILEAYMNQIYLGRGYGIQSAARNYFGKNAIQMNPAESALLAAIANNPGRYNPVRNPERAQGRRNMILDLMVDQGYLTPDEGDQWKAFSLPEEEAPPLDGVAPYFEEWVRQILDDRFGSQLYSGGLRVYTTLDLDMQMAATAAMQAGWDRTEADARFPHQSYEELAEAGAAFDGAEMPYLQGAFIAVDPYTGHVKAMVGGRDFSESKFDRVRQARRQAGSVFKPFVYTAAVSTGIPASHIVVDGPVTYPQVSGEDWRPSNFESDFRGPITIREGLRKSINMIAIKLGWEEVGIETVAQTAERMGIRTEVERFPSTTLGAVEVTPIQLVEAYSAFTTLGTKVRPHPILKVESADGEILWEPQPDRQVVLDSLSARVMVDMLQDVVDVGPPDQGTAFGGIRGVAQLPYEIPAGGKTGTTNDGTDTWFVGFTPNLVAGVWFGFDRPRPIFSGENGEVATGGGLGAPVWGDFMRRVYYGNPEEAAEAEEASPEEKAEPTGMLPIPQPWPIPPGLTTREVDSKTGKLASRWCPAERRYTEFYVPGTEPTEFCDDTGRIVIGRRTRR